MNLLSHRFTREQSSEPLHQLLLGFGKGLWQRPLVKPTDVAADMLRMQQADNATLQRRVEEMTIQQMVIVLRMQHPEAEELIMLHSLESLVKAGEIEFRDFVGRVQNLFPLAIENMDVPLRMKIASLML